MLMFTLAISYLTTSNFPWFMDLTFQDPVQYCSLQHQIFLPSPVTSTTGHCFHFGSISSFFLELISPLFSSSILGTFQPGEFIFQCPIFLPFHTVHGVLKARILSGLPFSSPVDRILSECMEVRDIVQEAVIKTVPKEKKCKRAKWLSDEALQIA